MTREDFDIYKMTREVFDNYKMTREVFDNRFPLSLRLSVRISERLSHLHCLPPNLDGKLPIKVVESSGLFIFTFLMDDEYAQSYAVNPVLLQKCILTKRQDFDLFTNLMTEALSYEKTKDQERSIDVED